MGWMFYELLIKFEIDCFIKDIVDDFVYKFL